VNRNSTLDANFYLSRRTLDNQISYVVDQPFIAIRFGAGDHTSRFALSAAIETAKTGFSGTAVDQSTTSAEHTADAFTPFVAAVAADFGDRIARAGARPPIVAPG
jgi:hypothetical protein